MPLGFYGPVLINVSYTDIQMKKCFLVLSLMLCSFHAVSDEPTYSDSWQWNNNVKIDYIYGFNESNSQNIQVKMDNGEFCHVPKSETINISIILAMRAQQSIGQIVCFKEPTSQIDNLDSRRIHRIRY